MDKLTKSQRSKNMKAVRSTGSIIETTLAKKLFSLGYRYRKNNKTVFGKPDITIKTIKLAIFVDSEFWHGKDWETAKLQIKSNKDFWYKKIENNIARDKLVNETLEKENWTILRFWGNDIKKNLDSCILKIEETIKILRDYEK